MFQIKLHNGKRAFAVLLTAALILTFVPAFSLTASAAGTSDTDWYNTTDTEFYISTADELAGLAQLVNSNIDRFAGKTVTLTDDIILSGYQSGEDWTPIGRDDNTSFKGTFDGGGNMILGLTVNRTDYYTGLFGQIGNSGTVKNLGVLNASVRGGSYTGGVAGYVFNGLITNCYVTGSVSGSDSVGGIAGYLEYGGSVTDCYSACSVRGTSNSVGGIVGRAAGMSGSYCRVTNCWASGTVSGSANVGGIAGYISTSYITNCAAFNPSVSGNTSIGRVTGAGNWGVSNVVAWDGMTVNGVFQSGVNGDDITAASILDASAFSSMFTDNAVWAKEAGKLPGLFGRAVNMPEHLGGTPLSALYVNDLREQSPLTTVTDIQNAVSAALSVGDTVIVTGTLTGTNTTLSLTIPEGNTVTWAAEYSGSLPSNNHMLIVSGAGTLEIAGGGKLINSSVSRSRTVFADGPVTIHVYGEVSNANDSAAIWLYADNSSLAVGIGSIVKNTGSGDTVYLSNNSSALIDGGTVLANTGNAIFMLDTSTAVINSGAVQGTMYAGGSILAITGGTITGGAYLFYDSTIYVSGGTIASNSIYKRSPGATAYYTGANAAAFSVSGGSIFTPGIDLFKLDASPALTKDTAGGDPYVYSGTAYEGTVVASLPSGLAITGVTANPSAAVNTFSGNTVTFAGSYDSGASGLTLAVTGTLADDKLPVSFTTAAFGVNVDIPITITYTALTGGSVSRSTETIGAANGTALGSTAMPGTNYIFDGWFLSSDTEFENIRSSDPTFVPGRVDNLNVSADYVARFLDNANVTVNYSATAGGSVSLATESLASITGDALGSTATTANGYYFDGWYRASDTGFTNKLSPYNTFVPVKVDDLLNVAEDYVALFLENSNVNITYTALTGGSVSPETQSVGPATGSPSSTATADAGYHFTGWFESGADYEHDTPITTAAAFTPPKVGGLNVAGSYVARFFEDDDVTIIYTALTGGSVNPTAQDVGPATGSPSSTATAETGYCLEGWYAVDDTEFEDRLSTSLTFTPAKDQNGLNVFGDYVARFVPVYEITVVTDGHGVASADAASAAQGAQITLTATANSGYQFKEWQVVSGSVTLSSATANPATFQMPDNAVEVKAVFAAIPAQSNTGGNGGSASPSEQPNHGFAGGDSVYVKGAGKDFVHTTQKDFALFGSVSLNGKTLKRDKDYKAESGSTVITLFAGTLDTLAAGAYTLDVHFSDGVVVTENFTVEESAPGPFVNPFTDVNEGDWFFTDAAYVYLKGLMTGTSADPMLFSPNRTLTRGMVVTVLYRMAGEPDVTGLTNPFSDVPEGRWYTSATIWAVSNGIVTGKGNGKFGPDENITRQDLAVILYRYAGFAGIPLPVTRDDPGFLDDADIANYAKEAVDAFFRAGVINGKPGNRYDPQGSSSRAEFAAMVHRMLEAAGDGE